MIPPIRSQLTQTASPTSLACDGAEPRVPFQELLAQLGAAPGFLAAAPLMPSQEADQSVTAEVFNQSGFFSSGKLPGLQSGPEAAASSERDVAEAEDFGAPAPATSGRPLGTEIQSLLDDPAMSRVFEATRPGLLRTDFTPPHLVVSVRDLIPEEAAPLGGDHTSPNSPASQAASKSSTSRIEAAVELQTARQAAAPPSASQAAMRTAVSLSRDSTGVTVAARVAGLDAEERGRLERQIVEELARRGLSIGSVILTGAVASRDEGKAS